MISRSAAGSKVRPRYCRRSGVAQPPLAERDVLALHLHEPVHVEVAEVVEGQEARHLAAVPLLAHCLEVKDACAARVQHDAELSVEGVQFRRRRGIETVVIGLPRRVPGDLLGPGLRAGRPPRVFRQQRRPAPSRHRLRRQHEQGAGPDALRRRIGIVLPPPGRALGVVLRRPLRPSVEGREAAPLRRLPGRHPDLVPVGPFEVGVRNGGQGSRHVEEIAGQRVPAGAHQRRPQPARLPLRLRQARGLKDVQSLAELDLVLALRHDAGQLRRTLAMHRPWPAQRMDEADRRRVGADEGAGQPAGALQPGVVGFFAGRFGQTPVEVRFVLSLARRGIGPDSPTLDHDRRLAQECRQVAPRLPRRAVALYRQGEAVGEVSLVGLPAGQEARRRRAEHGRVFPLCRLLRDVERPIGEARITDASFADDARRLLPSPIRVSAQGDPCIRVGVAEDGADERRQVGAVRHGLVRVQCRAPVGGRTVPISMRMSGEIVLTRSIQSASCSLRVSTMRTSRRRQTATLVAIA